MTSNSPKKQEPADRYRLILGNRTNSLLSGYQEEEEQCFRKHFLEAEKHEQSFVRTRVKEKWNIIKNIPRDFCLCSDPEACLILIRLLFASVQSHRYLLLLTDDVYNRIIESCLKRTCGYHVVHPSADIMGITHTRAHQLWFVWPTLQNFPWWRLHSLSQ